MVFMTARVLTGFLLIALTHFPLTGAVRSITVSGRSPVLDGRIFGKAGAYERVTGTVRFAVDPQLPANRAIADLELAPRNTAGQVEFSSNFYILQPINAASSNGTALVEVSN